MHVVLPGDVDDPAAPSGGNSYDRRVCAGLAATGWAVHRITVAGAWPWPDRQQLHQLGAALDALPRGAVVLLDGLVGCAAPEVLEAADRLRLVLLIHLPLADETGLAPAQAADLDARERRAVQAAAVVLATSVATGQRLIADHALAAGRVHVAPPGVDPAPLTAPSSDGGRLVCVASITPRKVSASAHFGNLRTTSSNSTCASSTRCKRMAIRAKPSAGAGDRPAHCSSARTKHSAARSTSRSSRQRSASLNKGSMFTMSLARACR